MSTNPYDYENRTGILPISWNDMHGLCRAIVRAVAANPPDIVLPVGRGGFYPGTLVAHMLRADVYPVRLSRRVKDAIVHEAPQWLLRPPDVVRGKRVLVVDEISSTGETLTLVKREVEALGATDVQTAVLYAHSWSTEVPDYIGLVSDALIINPWDREVWHDGALGPHPEYVAALAEQGISTDDSFLIPARDYTLAKSRS